MEKITKYRADDGTVFDLEEEAIEHERKIAFIKWYHKHTLIATYHSHPTCSAPGMVVDPVDLFNWLREQQLDVLYKIIYDDESGNDRA